MNLFWIDAVYSKTINFSFNNYRYHLKYDSNLLIFKDQTTQLSLEAKKCNLHILKYTINMIENYLSRPYSAPGAADSIKLEMDNKIFYMSPHTNRGAYFFNFRNFMIAKKVEEDLSCK